MRVWCCAAIAAAAVGLAVPVSAENRALLVGVGEYRDDAVSDLPGVNLDIDMMRDVAVKLGFKPNEIKVLFDKSATLEEIRIAFDEWLVGGAGPTDRVLFYFSGHGSYVPDTSGDETDDKLDEVLLPHDTALTNTGLNNVLSDDVLGQWLARLQAGVSYVLVDACHSGSVTKGVLAPTVARVKYFAYPQVPKASPPAPRDSSFVDLSVTRSGSARYIALAAAADNEQSLASPKGSYFTLGVLKAVSGAASSRRLTLRETQKTAGEEITRLAAAGTVHHPQLGGDLSLADDNLFATTAAPAPQPESAWAFFELLVDEAPARLEIRNVQPAYGLAERMQLDVTLPRGGYLNVITISEVTGEPLVLFPNKYATENRLEEGPVRLPANGAKYRLSFALPPGASKERNLLVAFLTDEPLSAYEKGSGPSVFRTLPTQGVRSTRGAVVSEAGYAAGKAVYVLAK